MSKWCNEIINWLEEKTQTAEEEKNFEYPQKDATLSSWGYDSTQGSWPAGGQEAYGNKDPPHGEMPTGLHHWREQLKNIERTNSTQLDKKIENLKFVDESG